MKQTNHRFQPDIIVEVTNGCNMSCKGCYAANILTTSKTKAYSSLSLDVLMHNWPAIDKVESISVRGGEPTLNTELIDILKFLIIKSNKVFLETNGTWINNQSELIRELAALNITVKLSVDSMHKTNKNDLENKINVLKSNLVAIAIAITEDSVEMFESTKNKFIHDFNGDIYWHKKATTDSDLIKPNIGVINRYGIFQKTLNSKFSNYSAKFALISLMLLSFSQNLRAAENVYIGIAANFSSMSDSTSNPYSNHFRNALEMVIDENKVQLKSRNIKINLVELDYSDEKSKVISTAEDAVKSNVIGVLGYIYSSDVLLSGPIFNKNKLLLITPTASADRVEEIGPYVRRTCFEDSFQGKVLAKFSLINKKMKTAGIVSVADCAYCQSLSSAFKKNFESIGGKVLIETSVLSSETDFSEVIEKFKKQQVDVILVPNYEKISASIMASLIDSKVQPKYWLGGDGWGNSLNLFKKIIGNRIYKAITVSHWHSEIKTKKSKKFIKSYAKRFNKSPVDTTVLTYDAATLLVESILKDSKLTRESLFRIVSETNSFTGVTGKIVYKNSKRTPIKQAIILMHENGEFSLEKVVHENE